MARGIRIKLRTAAEGTKVEIHLSRETLADLLEHGETDLDPADSGVIAVLDTNSWKYARPMNDSDDESDQLAAVRIYLASGDLVSTSRLPDGGEDDG